MTTLVLPERLLIAECAALRESILGALDAAEAELSLDASAVQDLDGAGLQLLLSTVLEARKRGVPLQLQPSATVQRWLTLLQLDGRVPSTGLPQS